MNACIDLCHSPRNVADDAEFESLYGVRGVHYDVKGS